MKVGRLLLFCALTAGFSGQAAAQDVFDVFGGPQSRSIMPMESILAQARDAVEGTVTEIELERKKGAWVYEVEIVQPNGAKVELMFDARSGRLLSRKGG